MKDFIYNKGVISKVDEAYKDSVAYGNVRLACDYIFWKNGLRKYVVAILDVERVYRRVEEARSKVCCGNANFDTEKLMVVMKNGDVLEMRIGDGTQKEAVALYEALKEAHPELKYGKEKKELL